MIRQAQSHFPEWLSGSLHLSVIYNCLVAQAAMHAGGRTLFRLATFHCHQHTCLDTLDGLTALASKTLLVPVP